MTYLRDKGFRFVVTDKLDEWFEDIGIKINLKEKHKPYSWMVLTSIGKTPDKDIYHTDILVGFKMVGVKKPKILVYEKGIFKESIKLYWPKPKINMRKKAYIRKFPDSMSIELRKKWRYIDDKLKANKEVTTEEKSMHFKYLDDINKLNNK